MKKTLSLILALLMSISTASVAFADEVAIEEEVAVEEVVAEEEVVESPYVDAVKYLNTYKIYKGNGEDLDTESDVNRWQMALFAARLATGWVEDDKWEDGPQNSSEFTDLAGTYAENVYGAISYVNQMGIIEGYGDGTFGPMKGITYQDALTIVVRTLGYQNLDWPWGYIQKGVELGLTEGVVEVAYTDTLTRGEVAQIIYNALFAETKGGSTLGLDSFGIEFGWEDVVIVSSDRDMFTDLGDKYAPASFVGFQLIEDGELDGTVYYAKAADLGLEGHDDELAVGASYEVFFEKDADSELVSIIDYKTNYVDTVWNFGKTDDEGVAVDGYAIETLFDTEYKLVSKYSDNYLGNSFAAKDEMIVVDALGAIVEIEYVGESNIGIDMNTGDIVKFGYDEENEKEIVVVETLWYWNEKVEHYYKVYDKNDKIGIEYMDADDEADLLEQIQKDIESVKKENVKNGFAAAAAIDEDSAYASLDIYNVNGKAYGIYEEYKFGYFTNSTTKDCSCDGDPARASYKIKSLVNFEDAKAVEGVIYDTYEEIVEGACEHGRAWINDAFAANLQEDGTYANGYVIYSVDAQTGEIKIVKYINDCEDVDTEDVDTYVGHGTIKAFSVNDEYVVIGGEKLTFNYDNLEGTGIINANKDGKTQYKSNYSDDLRKYFNQYVEYVVVDGEIVYMTVTTGNTSNLFVVEKYAGISSDGYIVVDGYWTKTATELERIRVASYNNNFTGDPFYYMTAEKAEKAFTKGSVYAVSSTEPDENDELVYNMQIVGGPVKENGKTTYVIDTDSKYVADTVAWSLDATDCGDGYLSITKDGTTSTIRNKVKTYILVGNEVTYAVDAKPYVPVAVYVGEIADADWEASGELISDSNDTYLVVNATWVGFSRDKASAGVVALLGDYYWTADFDGNDTEDWYLLGAAKYTVEVFNFFNASTTTVEATNLDLAEGYVYNTIDGTIVYDAPIAAADLKTTLQNAYMDTTYGSADYLFGDIAALDDTYLSELEENVSKAVSKQIFTSGKEYPDLIDKITAKVIELDTKGRIDDIVALNADELAVIAKENKVDSVTLKGFWIYDTKSTNAYVYAFNTDVVSSSAKGDAAGTESTCVAEIGKNAYIGATAEVAVTTEVKDGVTTKTATLSSISLEYIGKAATETHASVEFDGRYFGNAGECKYEDWNTEINGEEVYGSIENGMYDNHEDEDICNLIKKVTFDGLNVTVKTGEDKNVNVKFVANKNGKKVPYNVTLHVFFNAKNELVFDFVDAADTNLSHNFTWVLRTAAVLK